jgi:hypothetical protein
MGSGSVSGLPLAARHEVTLANRVALGQAGSTLLPRVSPTRPAFRLRRAAIRPPTPCCAAGSLSSTSGPPCQRRRALPNMSVNRTRYGKAPWPRSAVCHILRLAARAPRLRAPVTSTLGEFLLSAPFSCQRHRASAPRRVLLRSRPSAFAGARRGHPVCQLRLRCAAATAAARCWAQ